MACRFFSYISPMIYQRTFSQQWRAIQQRPKGSFEQNQLHSSKYLLVLQWLFSQDTALNIAGLITMQPIQAQTLFDLSSFNFQSTTSRIPLLYIVFICHSFHPWPNYDTGIATSCIFKHTVFKIVSNVY